MTPAAADAPGPRRIVGRYRLEHELGRGAMGTVWSAYDEVLHRPVAVKEVRLSSVPVNERAIVRERTLREARATAMLSHPNVVTLYDVVEVNSEPYVVMELLPSRSLASYIGERGTLTQPEAAEIGSAVASALTTAHRAGITHRDVKPGNVLIGENGQIKLTDFGIARNAAEQSMTQTGTVLGSPPYIAPEVAMGRAVGPAADLWGLGATLFACLEGRPPYDAGDPVTTVTEVVHGEVPVPSGRGPVVDVIRGLMVKDPALRMPLAAVRRRLRPLLSDPEGPVLAAPPPPRTAAYRMPPPGEESHQAGLIPVPRGPAGTLVEGQPDAGGPGADALAEDPPPTAPGTRPSPRPSPGPRSAAGPAAEAPSSSAEPAPPADGTPDAGPAAADAGTSAPDEAAAGGGPAGSATDSPGPDTPGPDTAGAEDGVAVPEAVAAPEAGAGEDGGAAPAGAALAAGLGVGAAAGTAQDAGSGAGADVSGDDEDEGTHPEPSADSAASDGGAGDTPPGATGAGEAPAEVAGGHEPVSGDRATGGAARAAQDAAAPVAEVADGRSGTPLGTDNAAEEPTPGVPAPGNAPATASTGAGVTSAEPTAGDVSAGNDADVDLTADGGRPATAPDEAGSAASQQPGAGTDGTGEATGEPAAGAATPDTDTPDTDTPDTDTPDTDTPDTATAGGADTAAEAADRTPATAGEATDGEASAGTAAEDTSGKDTSGKDASGKDTSGKDASGKDTGAKDTGAKDTGAKDTAGQDTTGPSGGKATPRRTATGPGGTERAGWDRRSTERPGGPRAPRAPASTDAETTTVGPRMPAGEDVTRTVRRPPTPPRAAVPAAPRWTPPRGAPAPGWGPAPARPVPSGLNAGSAQPLAADPGPLPFTPSPRPARRPRSPWTMAAVVALLVLMATLGIVGGYALTRSLAGQDATSVWLQPAGPKVAGTVLVTHADTDQRYSGTGLGFTALVPAGWQQFRLEQPGGDIAVRFVSPDASRELRVDRVTGFYPAQHAADYAALLGRPAALGVDASTVNPLEPVGTPASGTEGPQQTVYRTTSGSNDDRTTWTRLVPSGTDLWVVRLTAPSTNVAGAPEQFWAIADSFAAPPPQAPR